MVVAVVKLLSVSALKNDNLGDGRTSISAPTGGDDTP